MEEGGREGEVSVFVLSLHAQAIPGCIHLDDSAVYPGPPPWKDALGHGSESSSGTSWKGQWRCLDCV